ncbi:hypothetical protein VZT92_022983 [Zoarces viviparus]|uniref:Alkylated DNA repair protein AlkB homologue 8 N-terminal domain-containing protein n=1 Tax=Zoarces viviparus TaxID=48416 RepID=A0AAW1E5Y2_ZOAVI
MAPHFIHQHLDSYARILFVDFSSAFNTIIPSLLHDKLSQLHVPDCTCKWITDFLSDTKISSITKKTQQRMYFLRQLKKSNLPKTMMVHFYAAVSESILCSSISVWYVSFALLRG